MPWWRKRRIASAISRIVRGHRTAFSGGDDLARVEREAAEPPEAPARAALPTRPERARSVLEQRDTVRDCGLELLPRSRTAEEVDDEDSLRPRRECSRDRLGGHVHRLRVDVDEHRPGAHQRDDVRGRGEGVGRDDHLVARPDPERQHREVQCRRAGGDDDRVLDLTRGGERALELLDAGAHGQLAAPEDLLDRRQLLGAEIRPGETDHAGAGWRSRYHAIVRARPSSRSTFGSQPSSLRALSMFGIRISTSV